MRRQFVSLYAVALCAVLVGCGSSSSVEPSSASSAEPKAAGGTEVTLKLLQYKPETATVKAGTKVIWRNDEPIAHTVTSGTYSGVAGDSGLRTSEKPNGLFDADLGKKDSTASYTFAKAGTYPYYCDIHKGMNAKVVVTP